jgi:hypothetical protein
MEIGSWWAHPHDLYPFGSVSLSAGTNSILSGFSPVFAQENLADTRPARVSVPRRVKRVCLATNGCDIGFSLDPVTGRQPGRA